MAALTEQDRVAVWTEFMSRNKDSWGAVEKLDIRAAVDDLDTWFNANKASALAAITEPSKSELTGSQIALLSNIIIAKRWLQGA